MNLQCQFDADQVRQAIREDLESIEPYAEAA